jgi:hypothetical protein
MRMQPVQFSESPFSMMYHTNFDETHPHILPPTDTEYFEPERIFEDKGQALLMN